MANEFVVKNGLISPNVQLQGSTSGSVTIAAPAVAGTASITLPSITGTLVTTGDTGTVTNTMLAGSIANAKLVNSAVTVGSTSISLGASSTTLAGLTSVTSTSFVGALTGNASTATTLQTARTIALSGDVAGSVSFDGSANATISATIQPDSVALGTDTTGNYMVNVSAGTGVTVSHTQGEGSTATVSIGQAVGTTDNVTFNNVTVNGTLTSDDITSASISVAGNATITGNLTVSGTTTTINSTTIAIADLNLELARNATTATQANGAGITVTGPATAATLTYSSTDDRWNLNKNLNISRVYGTATNVSNVHTAGSYLTGGTFDGSAAVTWAVDATPSNTASKVVARDASGNFSASTITAALAGNASTASSWQTARTLSYTGDATGSLSVDGSTNVSTALTLAASGVTAGTYNNVTVNAKGLVTSGSNVAYLTSYSETDTLATVTARGASTSSQITVDSVITTNNGNGTNIRLGDDVWIGDVNLANTFRIRGNQDAAQGYITFGSDNTQFGRNGTGALTWGGNTVWHAGNLTNLNQLTNGPGYITGYTETDTLASVTGRGFTSRASSGTFATATQGTPGLEIYGGGTTEPAYMTFHRPGVYAVRFGLDGSDLKVGGWSMGAVSYKMWHEGNLTNLNQLTNGPGYITTESDTLATVTGRGASTSTKIDANGGIYAPKIGIASSNLADATNGAPWYGIGASTSTGWYGNQQTVQLAGYYGLVLKTANTQVDFDMTGGTSVINVSSGALKVGGNTVYHTGNVPGWLTAESDTLGSVTGRGASTTSLVTFAHNASADPLSAVHITGGGTHTGLYINPTASSQAHIRFGNGGTLKWQIRVPFQDSANTDLKYYSWVAADDIYTFSHTGIGYASGSWRAPVFYDSNDTAYYGDFASTSNIYNLTIKGVIGDGTAPFKILPVSSSGSFQWASTAISSGLGSGQTMLHILGNALSQGNSGYVGFNYTSANSSSNFVSLGFYANDNIFRVYNGTYSQSLGSLRAPVFYDSDNTGYYTDPASTSNLNALTTNGQTILGGQLYVSATNPNTLNSGWGNAADGSDIWINYRGYNDGQSYYRNFNIGNGRGTAIFWADGSTGNIGIGAGQNAGARLHVRRGTPSGVQAINGNATVLLDNTGDNFIQFRNSADNGTYSGLLFSDNNQGGYVVFGNAGAGDLLRLGGYSNISFDVGYDDSTSSVAIKTQRGYIDVNANMFAFGSMRSPIFYDYNDTGYYLDPNSVSVLNKVAVGGNFVQTVYEDVKRYSSLYSSGTQAIRHTIGRIYFTPNHWGDWSAVNIKLQEITYSQGSIEYNIWGWYGMGNGSSLNIDAVATNGWARADYRVTLGSVTSAGWQYASHDTYYQDVYLDIDYYAGVEVMIGVEQSSITTSNPGSGTGWAYVFYDSPAQANISSFDETHQLRDRYSRRTNNLIIGSGTYGNIITPIGDSNMNLITPSGAVYFDAWPRMYGLYDQNDTSYYLDPNSQSFLYYASVNVGQESTGAANSSNAGLVLRGNYNSNTWAHKFHKYDNGNGVPLYLSYTAGAGSWSGLQGWGAGLSYTSQVFGSFSADSLYSTIYYDRDNTGYYVDPASTSQLNVAVANRFSVPNSALISVGDDSATYTYNDNSTRSRIYISSQYPVLTLNSTVGTGNSNHGATLQFTFNGYDSNRQWVIGGSGTGTFLDFGTGQSSIKNPHDGIAGYGGGGSAQTVMRMTTTGVGVGGSWGAYGNVGNPSYPLHVQGTGYASGDFRAPVFYDSDNTGFYINAASSSNLNTVYANFFCGNGGNAYGVYKGYDNNNHFIAIRGSVSGNTTSPTITGAHHTTFVEYAEANDSTGWFFKTAGTGNYDIVSRITRSYSYFEGSARSPLFYDSDNTGYYANPAGRSNFSSLQFDNGNLYMYQGDGTALRIQTAYGWINFGAQNSSWTHVYADRAFYTNQDWYVNGNLMHHDGNASRARNNYLMYYQGFTLDANTMDHNATGFTYANNAPATGPIARFSTGGGYDLWLNAAYTGGNTLYFRTRNGDAGSINSWRALASYGINYGDTLYGTVFYDANDTGYYADPNGTSVFSNLTINGTLNAYANPVKVNRINFTNTSGSQASDPYCFRWRSETDGDTGSASWLELQMNDDDYEEFRIYGYSCQGYGCGQLSSNLYHRFRATGYAWHAGNLETGGSITASGNVTAYSDERLKKDITTIENPLDKVMQLRGVNYTMIKDDSKSIGVVAQEIEKIIPEVVQTSEEGIKSVAYGNMVGLLIEAIKEQQKQIEELKGIINEIRR